MDTDTSVAAAFHELWRDVDRATAGTVLVADCEFEYSRLLKFVEAHLEARPELAEVFCRNISSYPTRFCMRHLRWPEVAEAARTRLSEDILLSERDLLERLLAVYDS